MADSPTNRLNPVGPEAGLFGPGTYYGDLPEQVARRYYSETRLGAPFAFFKDARTRVAAFRDHGGRLSTVRNDPDIIRDLVTIAKHRDWTTLAVRGAAEFRREVWITARAAGLEVCGYRPTERDLQDLERRAERAPATAKGERQDEGKRTGSGLGAATRLKVVEAVVKDRIVEPAIQARILMAARGRLADWLERSTRHGEPSPGRPRDKVR